MIELGAPVFDLRWAGDRLMVALPNEVVTIDGGRVGARYLVREPDLERDPHDEMRVLSRRGVVAVGERTLQNNAGDMAVQLHVFGPHSFVVEQESDHEMRWALARDGSAIVTTSVDEDDDGAVLMANVRDTKRGKVTHRFTVAGVDELDCDAVAIGGGRAAMSTEAGVMLFQLAGKSADRIGEWTPPGPLASLHLLRVGLRGIGDGVVWLFRDNGAVLGSKLACEPGAKGLGLTADGEWAYWLARERPGAPWDVMRLLVDDGRGQAAGLDLGDEPPIVALSGGARRIARAAGEAIEISAFEPRWRDVT